ncbi:hypothetical protein VTN00DRAFT_2645 [Thermoascus crustaceus]|uniref:uncharacterized protein n=1 Tax=Thermoascus crustaceus TaxID=5088 RepID=UPI0037421F11
MAQIVWIYLLPESPRWLIKHNRHDEAIDIIAQVRGKDIDCTDPAVLKQKKDIDDAVALEEADGPWKITEVYYAPHTLTTDIGMEYKTALQIAAGLGDPYWLFSFIPVFFLDRMGRRKPLIIGALICSLSFICAGILQKDVTPIRAKASLGFFFLYEAVFAVGWLPIPWLYPAEFMPLRHRTHSAAPTTASH